MTIPLLDVQGLTTTFYTKQGPLRAVDSVSYSLHTGEILGVVGESGCGKSVSSYSLMGLIEHPGKVTAGAALFEGVDLFQLSEEERQNWRGSKMAMIFQEPMTALNPVVTIGKQITEQLLTHSSISKSEARDRAIMGLKEVGIPAPEKRIDQYPHQLSGGMRQRAMIAMALSCNPTFLIADEPTTALDVTIQAQILELMQKLQEERGMTIQFITHDLGVISELTDRVMVMYMGRVAEICSTSVLFEQPRHPYTHALVRSIPKLGQRVDRLPTIEGSVAPLHERPQGCAFQNRCDFVKERCRQEQPPLQELAAGHSIACFYPVEGRG
jgi:peptide/nickel transport system ATP-binding protein